MLRTIVIALALGAPAASAEQFRESAVGIDVRSDDGAVVGEVAAVERNADGEIVAAEIEGLEPADAPMASGDLVAETDSDQSWIPANARDESERGGVSTRTATR
jgi:hypothetical protein